jgi:hypothetical protein
MGDFQEPYGLTLRPSILRPFCGGLKISAMMNEKLSAAKHARRVIRKQLHSQDKEISQP